MVTYRGPQIIEYASPVSSIQTRLRSRGRLKIKLIVHFVPWRRSNGRGGTNDGVPVQRQPANLGNNNIYIIKIYRYWNVNNNLSSATTKPLPNACLQYNTHRTMAVLPA